MTASLRALEPRDLEPAGILLYESYGRAARERGQAPPWSDANEARRLAEGYLADPAGEALVADVDGAIAGVGFVRRRGEAATLGPIAVAAPGRGTGGPLVDDLIARAEAGGASAVRLFLDSGNAAAFALFAGRSFAALDVVAALERPTSPPPKIDAARGLEVAPFRAGDLGDLAALDLRLTGLDRRDDLARLVKLVARRRGAVVGFVGVEGPFLGPAVALDVADLGGLIARALGDVPGGRALARLSTATPTAMLVALGLGFRVKGVGTLMVRGVSPPARPPQLYGIVPEVL